MFGHLSNESTIILFKQIDNKLSYYPKLIVFSFIDYVLINDKCLYFNKESLCKRDDVIIIASYV